MMAMEKNARRFLISGRVQGVGYRAFAQRAAVETGVTGWARNLADGRVEAHANGTLKELDDFEARLRLGPRFSEVRGVEVLEAVSSPGSDFVIR
jgi:acylphosphatase